MTFCVDADVEYAFPFDMEDVGKQVAEEVLKRERCPYEAQICFFLTGDDEIRRLNREFRDTDKSTDVLSFPNLDFRSPADFSVAQDRAADCFDPESGELVLGDIVISIDHLQKQAEEYGHGLKREFAFLIAHSMLHLCGYDHMEEAQEKVMVQKQEEVLTALHITREGI